jgi:hypothetical protein
LPLWFSLIVILFCIVEGPPDRQGLEGDLGKIIN